MEPRGRGVLDTPLEPVIGLAGGETRWRGMTTFVSADLPDGLSAEKPVQSLCEKYSAFPVGQIISTSSPRPASQRGAFRDHHEREERDAVDAGNAADESAGLRTAKSCGPDAPTPASSFAELSA
jgi:hypothetical protein